MPSDIYIKIYIFLIIILSAVFHEYAHGFSAYKLGDDTAKRNGRLTLNPIAHIDLFGTIIFPILSLSTAGIFIGWAKPVPYNPFNLSDKKYGNLKVAAAGPVSNFIIALFLGIILRVVIFFGIFISPAFIDLISIAIYINIFLGLFNLIPVPPLDGSKILMDLFPKASSHVMKIGLFGMFIAVVLALYILQPIASALFSVITGISLF